MPKAPKRPYTKKFLKQQQKRLLEERQSVLAGIESEQQDIREWGDSDDVGVESHLAENATALTEQELNVTLIDTARYIVGEIDDALARLEDGTYGWDPEAETWIPEERLAALPWARRGVEGQRRLEKRLRHNSDGYRHDGKLTSF